MKTLFISQDLWEYVAEGYATKGVAVDVLKDVKKKDAKALFFIQQSVAESIFPRISAATKSKEAWDALKNGYQGNAKLSKEKSSGPSGETNKKGHGGHSFRGRRGGIIVGRPSNNFHHNNESHSCSSNNFHHNNESSSAKLETFVNLDKSVNTTVKMGDGTCLESHGKGYIFKLGSSAIAWSSKKQPSTALSSSEVKYMAANSAACQAVWLRRILKDMKQHQKVPTIVQCDNQSTIAMTRKSVFHSHTRHIETRHHFIRELVDKGSIKMSYCSTDEQLADIFTKPLGFEKFVYFRDMVGVVKFCIQMIIFGRAKHTQEVFSQQLLSSESEEVEKCIGEIVNGTKLEVYKKNAMELKLAAREAVSSGGSSNRNIHLFVNETTGYKSRESSRSGVIVINVDLKKEAMKDLEAGPDPNLEMTSSAKTMDQNLNLFLEEAKNVKKEMGEIRDILGRLQEANEQSKSLHMQESFKALRNDINKDIVIVLKRAKTIRT
ncbi:hypothetical protein EZV62_011208 [Acer yangbiense]|uniref:Syntaxin N-terminal domain-containing protein n=1 Tax=Acer yangbiense TaxID=1000413 RepID=A0A5C7I554_9ROSI|nr:hypothetical protein EZV62_011208 [Acer yangbiense]